MNHLPKIAKGLLIFFISAAVVLFSMAFLLQDKVSGLIMANINKSVSTKVEIGAIRLSFIRNFPRASVELKNVLVHSSQGFKPVNYMCNCGDTLLYSESVFMVFHPLDIIRGIYRIETVTARSGNINLLTDNSGEVNYNVDPGKVTDTSEVIIDLEKIILTGFKTRYMNQSEGFSINGVIRNGRLKSRIKGKTIDFTAASEIVIDSIRTRGLSITHRFEAVVDLNLHSNTEGIKLERSMMIVDGYEFGIEGSISAGKYWDLKINGHNIDISGFTGYLPEKIRAKASEYNPTGKLLVSCIITGQFTRSKKPHIEADCSLENGNISYPASRFSLSNISFNGHYTNGARNSALTSSVSLSDIKIHLGNSDYSGSLLTRNFEKPLTEIELKGRLYPAELIGFFGSENITLAKGSVDVDLRIKTDHRLKDSITADKFIDMQKEGSLAFNDFSLGLSRQKLLFMNVSGNVEVSDALRTTGLSFEFSGKKISLKGEYRNVPEWVAGKPVILYASGDITMDRFFPGSFTPMKGVQTGTRAVNFPKDMVLDLNFKIDSLGYKSFLASSVSGSLNYRPAFLTFKKLAFKAMNGSISGDGFIVQNKTQAYVSRGNFTLTGIDIRQTFKTFKNFGQNFILDENLSGDLSGAVSILLPLNREFSPRAREMASEGRFVIENGTLINFEPVKKLSSFIELSELENIQFDRLENDFFIRDNAIVIPQMDVKSSAADLTVNGRHEFSSNYEYHVKVLLSQLLSKKRKAARKPVTEFGAVKDDGLGRTSLLLKVENKGDNVKVSYDLQAVSQEVNKNLKSEKQSLRNILNEEYGWYKDEPEQSAPATTEKKVTRFNIIWDENDSVPQIKNEEEKKVLRNLFKKK